MSMFSIKISTKKHGNYVLLLMDIVKDRKDTKSWQIQGIGHQFLYRCYYVSNHNNIFFLWNKELDMLWKRDVSKMNDVMFHTETSSYAKLWKFLDF